MKLITKKIEATIPALYATEDVDLSQRKVAVKFFNPTGSWTWYVFEGEKRPLYNDWLFFGLVDGNEIELGYFTLKSLEEVRGQFGLGIERDIRFSGTLADDHNARGNDYLAAIKPPEAPEPVTIPDDFHAGDYWGEVSKLAIEYGKRESPLTEANLFYSIQHHEWLSDSISHWVIMEYSRNKNYYSDHTAQCFEIFDDLPDQPIDDGSVVYGGFMDACWALFADVKCSMNTKRAMDRAQQEAA